MKKLFSLVLAGTMFTTFIPTSLAENTGSDAKANLVNGIAAEARDYLASDDADLYIYTDMNWTDIADTLPSKFDLRDRNVVPPVRDQGYWGTCWSFGSIAAAEISLLSTAKITVDEFAEKVGQSIDLSERHLAWFGTSHLPTLDQYAEGEYPYLESQAGEGLWNTEDDSDPDAAHYGYGGMNGYSSSVFANAIGPNMETDYPYTANDGTPATSADWNKSDWSLPEEARYVTALEMLNSSILPSPSQRDADGNYYYNEAGTEAIKQELLAGRGVSIAYHADVSQSPQALSAAYTKELVSSGIPEDMAEVFAQFWYDILPADQMTEEQKHLFIGCVLLLNGYTSDQVTDDLIDQKIDEKFDSVVEQLEANKNASKADTEDTQTEMTADEENALREAAEKLGRDYDEYKVITEKRHESENAVYINTDTYAQYVDNQYASPDHVVTIIGWDDDYAVSNFPADHQPPAPGAWIVRNSWGEDYGIDGYFYLSYYDQTITSVETIEFVLDKSALDGVTITTYDNMEASAVSSVQSENPIVYSNIFPVEDESVLSYISVLTADLNAKVTASVYLLNDNFTSPTDGDLLDSVTEDFEFGGYHRISLNHNYQLPADSVISIVVRERTETTNGTRYSLPYTNGAGKEASEFSSLLYYNDADKAYAWSEGIINEGESFVCIDNEWYDWKEIVDEVKAGDSVAALVEFDDLNVKAYFYTVDGVYAAHNFGDAQPHGGEQAKICDDCGNMLVIVE